MAISISLALAPVHIGFHGSKAGYSGAGRTAGMCFSATASFSAASITALIGFATLRRVKHPRELLLGTMPLLFASQQAVEGALWLQLTAGGGGETVAALSLSFLVFAKVLWPAYAAPAVLLIEPDLRRRRVLYVIAVLGCAISIYVLNRLVNNPPAVAICGRSIDYGGHENALSYQTFVYLLFTSFPLLISSSRTVQTFGAIVAAGFMVSAYTYFATFISVWCFFAAAGSGVLYLYFRRAGPPQSEAADRGKTAVLREQPE